MRHQKRLARLERRWRPVDRGPAVMVVFPDDWPTADQAAFDGDDPATRDALVARPTGQRPGPRTRLIVIRQRPDGLHLGGRGAPRQGARSDFVPQPIHLCGPGLAGLTVAVRPTTTDGRFQVVFCHQQIGQSVLRDSDDV